MGQVVILCVFDSHDFINVKCYSMLSKMLSTDGKCMQWMGYKLTGVVLFFFFLEGWKLGNSEFCGSKLQFCLINFTICSSARRFKKRHRLWALVKIFCNKKVQTPPFCDPLAVGTDGRCVSMNLKRNGEPGEGRHTETKQTNLLTHN